MLNYHTIYLDLTHPLKDLIKAQYKTNLTIAIGSHETSQGTGGSSHSINDPIVHDMSFTVKPQLDPAGLIASKTTGEQVVKGVRISSGGAKQVLKEKPYISVEVSKDGFDFLKNNPDVGYPISAAHRYASLRWPLQIGCSLLEQQRMRYPSQSRGPSPHARYESSRRRLWLRTIEWQLSVHNCLVVRVDGEDITTCQVEALSHFTQYHLAEAFEDVMGERMEQFNNEGQKKEKEKVLDLITPQKSRESFLEFMVKKMEEDKDMAWVGAFCPI